MIELGQKVIIKPFQDVGLRFPKMFDEELSGTVIHINKNHHWFTVEYGKHKQRTCFKFDSIGNDVRIVDEEE